METHHATRFAGFVQALAENVVVCGRAAAAIVLAKRTVGRRSMFGYVVGSVVCCDVLYRIGELSPYIYIPIVWRGNHCPEPLTIPILRHQ